MIVAVDGESAPEELLRAVHVVEDEIDVAERGATPRTAEEAIASYRNPGATRRLRWLAFEGDEAAGLAALSLYGGSLSVGYVLVRRVFRRRGIGRALFDVLVAQARAEGIGAFFGEHATPAGAAFARGVGAVADQRHVMSVLDVRRAELPEPELPAGVELRSWVGAAPDELVESLVRARNAMADAPVPGGLEMPAWTVESQRRDEERCRARGIDQHVTVALEAGEIVALTGLRVPRPTAPRVPTDDTATVPTARGRGLATAVKLENLRRLRADCPDVEEVVTRNAEDNVAILAVNRKLGFVPTVTLTSAVVTL